MESLTKMAPQGVGRYYCIKVNIWNSNCARAGNNINFLLMNGFFMKCRKF